MKFAIARICLILLAGVFLSACQPASAPKLVSGSNSNQMRAKMPIRPVSASGQTVKLDELGWQLDNGTKELVSAYKGKVLLLDFWATYCGPCIQAIPHLKELQVKYKDKGLVVVGLNVGGEEDRPQIPAFVERLKIDYLLATPQDELIGLLFDGTTQIPQTFIVDREGKVIRNFIGYDPRIKVELDRAVEQAMSN